MRFYPTDVLIAVDHAERDLRRGPDSELAALLARHKVRELAALFDTAELTDALERMYGGVSRYPWQLNWDGDDVYEFVPLGAVELEDGRAADTLRGLLLGWATGNPVAVRTERAALWSEFTDFLRGSGAELPECRVLDPRQETPPDLPNPRPVNVPPLVLVGDLAGRLPADDPRAEIFAGLFTFALHERDVPEDAARIVLGADTDLNALPSWILALDCRSAWVAGLYRRDYRPGLRIGAARSADPENEQRLSAGLRYLVARARRAPFYTDLPKVRGIEDLAALPVLEKPLLEQHSLPNGRALYSDDVRSGEVLRSGSTTGPARFISYGRTDWGNMIGEAVPQYYAMGLRNGDRLINTLFGGNLYGGLLTSSCELSTMRVECYTVGQLVTLDTLLMLIDAFDANAVFGLPTQILPLLREAKAQRPELRLEKVLYGGAPMSGADRRWLREELGVSVITSTLAANDGAQVGYQCTEMTGGLHHVCPDYNYIEVVDDELNPVPAGDPGHLLITCMQKFEGPLIRYRIGDLGRLFTADCACGVSGPVLDYLGRSDGHIKLAATNFYHADVVRLLEPFGVSTVQIEVGESDGGPLTVRAEAPLPPDPDEVAKVLVEHLPGLRRSAEYSGEVDTFELIVQTMAESGLERHPVSGKVKSVIDRRLA